MFHALEWALRSDYPRNEHDPLLLRYDSEYAANIMTGRWRPCANKALAGRLRSKWREASAKLNGQLWCTHVRGHSNHRWNDAADRLAKIRAQAATAERSQSGTDRHTAVPATRQPREGSRGPGALHRNGQDDRSQ